RVSTEIWRRALSGPPYSHPKTTPSTLFDFVVVNFVPVICDAVVAGNAEHTSMLFPEPGAGPEPGADCVLAGACSDGLPAGPELPGIEVPHPTTASAELVPTAAITARIFIACLHRGFLAASKAARRNGCVTPAWSPMAAVVGHEEDRGEQEHQHG